MMTVLRFSLRLPAELYDKIRDGAQRDRRSIHSQVLWLIEQGLATEDHLKGKTT